MHDPSALFATSMIALAAFLLSMSKLGDHGRPEHVELLRRTTGAIFTVTFLFWAITRHSQ